MGVNRLLSFRNHRYRSAAWGKANKNAIDSGNVVVVSKGYCPYCKRAKGILEGYGIDPSKINIFEIENEPDMKYIQEYMGKLTGATSVPRVFIGGKFVGGADDVIGLHS